MNREEAIAHANAQLAYYGAQPQLVPLVHTTQGLEEALQETGCAIFRNGDCVTSVEYVHHKTDEVPEQYLLMTRRGVCILQCLLCPLADILKRSYNDYDKAIWTPARVQLVEIRRLHP